MSKTILAEVDGFTPLIDIVVSETNLITAAVFGRMWRYCQMSDGVCKASLAQIGSGLGLDAATVMRHAHKLVEKGYLFDLTPKLRNHPHTYADTGKAGLSLKVLAGIAQSNAGIAESNTGIAQNQLKKEEERIKDTSMKMSHRISPESVAIGMLNAAKNKTNYREDFVEWGNTWERIFGRSPTFSEKKLWEKEFRELIERKFTPMDLENAFHIAVFLDGMSISHPVACLYVMDELRQGLRNEDGTKKGGKQTKIKKAPLPRMKGADA